MGLLDALGPGPIALDTAIFVYFIEEHPRFLGLVRPIFVAAANGDFKLATSALTLMEVLVMPRRAGNARLAARYEGLLTASREVRLIEIGLDVLRGAAEVRAATGARTPDAIQLAAARSAGCPVFLTNDRRLPPVAGLRLIQLGEHAA
jgi:predicted nucleic acid-binding protein